MHYLITANVPQKAIPNSCFDFFVHKWACGLWMGIRLNVCFIYLSRLLFGANDLHPAVLGCQTTDSVPPQVSRRNNHYTDSELASWLQNSLVLNASLISATSSVLHGWELYHGLPCLWIFSLRLCLAPLPLRRGNVEGQLERVEFLLSYKRQESNCF